MVLLIRNAVSVCGKFSSVNSAFTLFWRDNSAFASGSKQGGAVHCADWEAAQGTGTPYQAKKEKLGTEKKMGRLLAAPKNLRLSA